MSTRYNRGTFIAGEHVKAHRGKRTRWPEAKPTVEGVGAWCLEHCYNDIMLARHGYKVLKD